MDNIKLTVTPQTNELIIREGSALPLKWPDNLKITGTIDAPAIFYRGKGENYDWTRGHVEVTKDTITLLWGHHENDGKLVVVGKLEQDPDLVKFGINSSRTFHQKELANMLKMNRIYFADRDENMGIVSSLEKLRVRVTQEIENGNDFKGNKKHLFEQNVQHEIRLQFTLVVPLYKGQEKKSFLVDVNFDITDGNTVFWLESVDLKELIETERIRIIDSQISKMGGLTIIYQ